MIERFGPPDTWHCSAPMFMDTRCYGEIHGHEILKRSRGGSIIDMDNVVLLCDFHNGLVEDFPDHAHREGLARHSWEVCDLGKDFLDRYPHTRCTKEAGHDGPHSWENDD